MNFVNIKVLFYNTKLQPVFKESFEFEQSDTKLLDKIINYISGRGLTVVCEGNYFKISAPNIKKVRALYVTLEEIILDHYA